MRPLRAISLGIVVLLVAAACTSDAPVERSELIDELIVEAEPTTSAFDPSDPDQLAGVSTSPSLITSGECFNEYVFRDRAEFLQQVTTIVSCDRPHDREAYFAVDFPGDETASYPLDDALERWADETCLDEFEAFIGLEYVLSELEIGAIVPTFESWTDDGDRAVICYVYPDEPGLRLRNSVAGSGI